jgi:hydrophobic/amphiphilic exporter-1 (mainly G- bacteria), HAE1 family
VSEATPMLPQAVKNYGVSVKKSLSFPLLVLTLSSPKGSYDNNFLSNFASINVVDSLARIPGVGQVNLLGGSDYAMRIWLRPDRIAKLGITVPDIVNAINQQNQLSPAGQIGGAPAAPDTEYTYTVRTQGRLLTAEQFEDIIVRSNPDGTQVFLKDVARIELGTQLYNSIGRLNGKPAAVITLFQIPGTNALEVADRVKATMAELSERFPNDLEYGVSLDTTLPVSEGITEIVHTLFEAIALVILVVFIFLQNWRATLIPLLTVPVSLIGAFMFFPLLGFSINVLSLLGLVLAIGIVVDDAIVVVEAVMHHIEQGMAPKDATRQAMKEVSGPVVAIALILTAVFVPVGFIPGITGSFYQQFAITIAISVLLSAFNALTLSPALAAMMLKPTHGQRSFLTPFYDRFNRVFGRGTDSYVSFTGILIRKSARSLLFIVMLSGLTIFLVGRIPAGFVPEEDQGYLLVNAMLPDASSLQRSDEVMKKVESVLAGNEAIEAYVTITGYSLITGAYSSNMGFFFIQLKEWGERTTPETHASGVAAALNKEFARQIPEAMVGAFGPPAIPGLGTGSGFTLQLQDKSGGTPEFLADEAQKFITAAKERPEIGRISTMFRASVPQIFADIDRNKVLKTGVPFEDVNTTLGALLGSSYVNDFNRFGRVYKVYVQAEPEFRRSPEQLGLFFVRSAAGDMVPLNTLLSTGPTLNSPTDLTCFAPRRFPVRLRPATARPRR